MPSIAVFENDWYVTRNISYADLREFNAMQKTRIYATHKFEDLGDQRIDHVSLENPSGILAFFIELNVVGRNSGKTVLPVFWDDNYISVL